MNNKVLLMILDGWGNGRHDKADVISTVHPEYISAMTAKYPHAELRTDGENVGLPDGQMGNSEVGHLNIGAGRVVYQDLVKINRACRDNSILENPEVKAAFEHAKKNGVNMHFMGLVSDGGVHSSIDHLFKLCDISAAYGLENTFVHCFMDGRDTDPHSGKGFVADLEKHLAATTGKIATVIGRYYAMDRDKRWDRIEASYNAMVCGEGIQDPDPVHAMEASYAAGVTDEFVKPVVCVPDGRIQSGDSVIFMNFRPDRAREMTYALTQADFDDFARKTVAENLHYVCTTRYDEKLTNLPVAFPPEELHDTLGEIVSAHGLRQLRIAETEKYAHVTFFFNGGTETQYPGEDRVLIPSPREYPTYDLIPEMSAVKVKDELVKRIRTGTYDMIVCNFANCDMVGHTGVMSAAIQAVECVDRCLGEVVAAAQEMGYTLLVTADHGNADRMVEPDGSPNTAHTTNLVPLVLVGSNLPLRPHGRLSDIAPTMLELMHIEPKPAMTGESLIEKS